MAKITKVWGEVYQRLVDEGYLSARERSGYYVNTDIPPFTRQYLKATPWDDPEIYARTSPMTKIQQAVTPTLIQHGENGFLFDTDSPTHEICALIERAFQVESDVRKTVEHLTWESFGDQVVEIIKNG